MYKSFWYTIALRYMRNKDDARDALQNALVNIYMKLDQYKEKSGSFKSWSARIVSNECIMYQRKYWKSNFFQEITDDTMGFSNETNPISALTTEEMVKQIQKLPDGYRVIFNMYAMEGYSHKEISEKLGISVGTSKSQLHKAKKILKKEIDSLFNIEKYA